MTNEFNSLEELFERVEPALVSREIELKQLGFKVTKMDIWDYLKDNVWSLAEGLNLYEMIDAILMIEGSVVEKYIGSRM